jgi:hypothetical protein
MFISKEELGRIRTFMDFLRVHLGLNKAVKHLSEDEKFHAQWDEMLRPAQSRLQKIEEQQEKARSVSLSLGGRLSSLETWKNVWDAAERMERENHMKRHWSLDGEMRIMIARMDKRKKNVSELYRRVAALEKLDSERPRLVKNSPGNITTEQRLDILESRVNRAVENASQNRVEYINRIIALEKKFLESEKINQDIHERVNSAIGDFAEHCIKTQARRKA